MSGYDIDRLFEVRLTDADVSTDRVRHYGRNLLPKPGALHVAHFPDGDGGYYLLYLDADGNEQTDTFHETIAAAMEQGMYEFGILADRWCALRQEVDFSNRSYRAVFRAIQALYVTFGVDGLGSLLGDMPHDRSVLGGDPAFPEDYRSIVNSIGSIGFSVVAELIKRSVDWADTDGRMKQLSAALEDPASRESLCARSAWASDRDLPA